MPLVLTAGAPTASGHDYNDIPGVSHVFPRSYRRLIVPGRAFIYYRGRRAKAVGLAGPAYFGAGVVGQVHDSGGTDLVCEIVDYEPFVAAVPIKRPDGSYYEPAAGNPNYWRRGVRSVAEDIMASILAAADLSMTQITTTPVAPGSAAAGYGANKQLIDEVERYSVDVALSMLREEFGTDAITEMPHGNPGFDVLITCPGGDLHVEVKGTRQPSPVFFLSEGERLHSEEAERYRLCVVSDIDLVEKSHTVTWHVGAVGPPAVALKPRQWEARLPSMK